MAKLAESLAQLYGRVEIFARGAEEERRAAEQALKRGHALEAREHARGLLARVPDSPLGLALWADAAEMAGLDDDVVVALASLCQAVPWRHELWLRLGSAGLRASWPSATAALERAANADDPAVARQALLLLADGDIAEGNIDRAVRWLERVPYHPSQPDPELALRRAECAIAVDDREQARRWAPEMPLARSDGRERVVRAALALDGSAAHGGDPVSLALGAYILDAKGAGELLSRLLSACRDAALVERARRVIAAKGEITHARWRAAFALAEGREGDARAALLEAAVAGERDAALALLDWARKSRDASAFAAVAKAAPAVLPAGSQDLLAGLDHRDAERDEEALAAFDRAAAAGLADLAERVAEELVAGWVPSMPREARWERVLTQLQRLAAAAQRIDIAGRIEALAVERERPLYVAVIGEFNAGKSTFLNALLGVDVAPTGVRPTTACLHWVAWAPDPFARVVVRGARDRVVMHSELKRALAELEASGASVDRVYIYAPIERLKRIEVLDTPGFNAPDASHGEQARRGVDEAHVALWLFDAGSPLKHSEREVLDPIARAGVPIQVLLNKKDRLKPGDLERVMEYLTSALGEIGLSSALLGEPVAMSARLALQGRLGDADALAASGWAEVERLLTEELVGNRDELRERALRRKARRIAVELVAALEEAAQRHQREAELMRDRQRRLRDQAAALAGKAGGRQRETLREQLAQALDRARVLLDDDMQPIAALPPERHADPAIASYRIDRTVARFAPAACQAIAETCHDDTVAATIEDPLRAVIAGAASVRSELSWSPALLGALAEALLRVAERALSSAAHDDSAGAHDDPALRRARALAAALA